MKCLLYCILETAPARQKRMALPERGAQPVFLLAKNGLTAVVSGVTQAGLPLEISQLMAYEKVVDWFFVRQTVIPMRYGCLFETEPRVIQHLGESEEEYRALLRRLAGCLEMGIRVIPRGRLEERPDAPVPDHPPVTGAGTTGLPITAGTSRPGHAYLAARHAYYAREEMSAQENAALLAQCRESFAGLFRECRTEICNDRGPRAGFTVPLLSLHFLVSRGAVGAFRDSFHRLSATGSARLLLSGPWPPYNFVMPRDAHAGEAEVKGGDRRDARHPEMVQ